MEQFCETIVFTQTNQDYARVINKNGTQYSVESGNGIFQVGRAVSCLVEPIPNDIVLIIKKECEPGYILAVLERQIPEKTTLQFQGDVEIKTDLGKIEILATDGLDLSCPKEINVTSKELNFAASIGTVTINSLVFWGSLLEAQIDKIKTIADSMESFVKHVFQKSVQSRKIIDQCDYVKSGQISYEAEKTLQLRGTFSQMTAKEDIHIDGERINIG
jgi:hypothetical protein